MSAVEDETLDAFVCLLEALQETEGSERRDALAGFVRSAWFSPCGFLLEGWQGELHREAWRYHSADLNADTPGKAWNQADPSSGRATILRLLGLEGSKHAYYAAHPFRMIWTQEDEPWIGAAVGCSPLLDAEMLVAWEHLDIRHVILWNPKSGRTRLLGDEQRTAIILPEPPSDTLEVFADTRAFFCAWAKLRASYADMAIHNLGESRDGHLPGALVIGGIDKVRFPIDVAPNLVARSPLTRRALHAALLKSANLPKIEEAAVAHG